MQPLGSLSMTKGHSSYGVTLGMPLSLLGMYSTHTHGALLLVHTRMQCAEHTYVEHAGRERVHTGISAGPPLPPASGPYCELMGAEEPAHPFQLHR